MKNYSILFLLPIVIATGCITKTKLQPEITINELSDHIYYLSSDSLRGRFPGTNGDQLAADYIRSEFVNSGIRLLGDHGFQSFEFISQLDTGKNNTLKFNNFEGKLYTDFAPFPFSGNGTHFSDIEFAGYGYSIKTDTFIWNSYENLNVKNKWVMILRGYPEFIGKENAFQNSGDDRDKAMLAADLGAAGVLFVSGEKFDLHDELTGLKRKEGSVNIPVIQINRKIADSLLALSGNTVISIENTILKTQKPFIYAIPIQLYAEVDLVVLKQTTQNVVGLLEAPNNKHKDEYLIIGAHYDHLGMGGPNVSTRAGDTIAVHHGADDNASGVSSMIEIAEKLASIKDSLERNVLFIAFGAEEMGLYGSKYFVDHPLLGLKNAIAMINLDMIGRLDTAKGLQIGGVGTSMESDSLIHKINKDHGFKLVSSKAGYGPSDHASFYGKNIPVFFFSTGAHTDYHTHRDVAEKINYEGLKSIDDYVYDLARTIINTPKNLTFQESGSPSGGYTGRRFKVTLGFMPDFTNEDIKGLRVDFVSKGKPADLGGMQNGDIIVAMDGQSVNNINDYMYRLSKLSQGQIVAVEVIRNEKKEVLLIQL
ncbi:MAG: M20/M25/M40 family metallo-hydrolase [Bacteroidales bacterium]|nr:M20/M25/M40 family metallo-hydrolase [Bacteroidales bacterium]